MSDHLAPVKKIVMTVGVFYTILVAFCPYVSEVNWSKSKCPYINWWALLTLGPTIEEKFQFWKWKNIGLYVDD